MVQSRASDRATVDTRCCSFQRWLARGVEGSSCSRTAPLDSAVPWKPECWGIKVYISYFHAVVKAHGMIIPSDISPDM